MQTYRLLCTSQAKQQMTNLQDMSSRSNHFFCQKPKGFGCSCCLRKVLLENDQVGWFATSSAPEGWDLMFRREP